MNMRWWMALGMVAALGFLVVPVLAQPGGGFAPGFGPSNGGPAATGQPLSLTQAETIARQAVVQSGNAGLVVAHIMEFSNNFYVAVKDTATGQGAFELLIDRYAGVVRSEPQSLTWNTEYGGSTGFRGPRGVGPGMMGGGPGPGMMGSRFGPGGSGLGGPANSPVQRDSAFVADIRIVHELLVNHDKITRSVTILPNGIRTVTESTDPQIANLIKAHVASMDQRLQEGKEFNVASPTLPTIFQNAAKIRAQIEQTANGVIVTQTSDDPATVTALHAHASEVSDLVQNGMVAFMRSVMANGGSSGFGPGGPMMRGGFGPGAGVGSDTTSPRFRSAPPVGGTSPLTLAQATAQAQQYLDAQLPGAKTGEAIAFPGYYTIDIDRNGKPIGMLSVNASTGQVWYHVWLGTFIREQELH